MIINTRPQKVADKAAVLWTGLEVTPSPMLEYAPVALDPTVFEAADALIITSQCAVANLPNTLDRDLPVYAVGPATAEAAKESGFSDVIAAGGTAVDLLAQLEPSPVQSGIYVSARHISRDLSKDLPGRITRVIGYEMQLADQFTEAAVDVIQSEKKVVVPFYSPRAFVNFETLIEQHDLKNHAQHLTVAGIHPRIFQDQRLSYSKQHLASVVSGAALSQMTAQLSKAFGHA